MEYEKTIYMIASGGEPEWFSVCHNRPEGVSAPETVGKLVYLPGDGFAVTMRCYEENPRAVYYEPNDPIYTDSCMEAYIDCFPTLREYGYLNLEMNANGAAYCSFGTGRYTRQTLSARGLPHPEVEATRGEADGKAFWQVQCLLPAELFAALYERPFAFAKGDRLRGNFYKCADHARKPHWASWAPVRELDFHAPECFGDFVIE